MTADRRAASGREAPALVRAGWWAADYLYAGWRQLAIVGSPLRRGRRAAPKAWRDGRAGLPEVVLVPGVFEHWTFLRPLGHALHEAGHRVSVVHGLGTNRRGIAETSDRLGRALGLTPAPAAGRVIVAHSKGGLIGKHLLIASGAAAAAVRKAADGGESADATVSAPAPLGSGPLGLLGLVAICTPFGGSSLASLFFVPSIRAFLPGDETIVSLGGDTSVNGRIVSVFGVYDPHVPAGSALDGATNVQVPGVGHFRILGDPETHRAVIEGVRLLAST